MRVPNHYESLGTSYKMKKATDLLRLHVLKFFSRLSRNFREMIRNSVLIVQKCTKQAICCVILASRSAMRFSAIIVDNVDEYVVSVQAHERCSIRQSVCAFATSEDGKQFQRRRRWQRGFRRLWSISIVVTAHWGGLCRETPLAQGSSLCAHGTMAGTDRFSLAGGGSGDAAVRSAMRWERQIGQGKGSVSFANACFEPLDRSMRLRKSAKHLASRINIGPGVSLNWFERYAFLF